MAYADGDSLLIRVRVAFGVDVTADPDTWSWTDITSYWHASDDIEITWGRSPGAEKAETHKLGLTLKNTDGRFTSFYPLSPHYPHVVQWTPISVDIDLGDGEGWRNRYSGFVQAWPTEWPGRSGTMALTKIKAVGTLARIGRGKPPEYSPMRRSIAASGPVVYWPCEDGVSSGQAASAIPGHTPMRITGSVDFVPVEELNFMPATSGVPTYGSGNLIDLGAGASLSGVVPPAGTAATTSAWTVHIVSRIDSINMSADVILLELDTPGGTFARWQLVWNYALLYTRVIAYTAAGASTVVVEKTFVTDNVDTFEVSAVQSGGNINVGLEWDGSSYLYTGSVAGTLAGITAIRVNPTRPTFLNDDEFPVGHVAIWAASTPQYIANITADAYGVFHFGAYGSWRREAAHLRLARLGAEDGVAITIPEVEDPELAVRMGRQQRTTPQAALYQECEDADGGLIYEDGFGLAYLPRALRYNPTPVLTIDGAARQLGGDFRPIPDSQLLRNRVTANRLDGSSAVVEDAASIAASGAIDTEVDLSLWDDTTIGDHAGWWVRRLTATAREPRYDSISLALHAGARALAADWCEVRPGSCVQVVNPPPQAPPGPIRQVVAGATEWIRRTVWRVSMSAEPASPWDVAEADGEARAPADGSTLGADIDADDLTISLTSTAENGVWVTGDTSTNPTDFPLDLRIGGERVTCTGISGSTSPQPATLSDRGVNGVARSWPAGTPVDVWDEAIAPL